MSDLILCASCSRHVRRSEARCPFCTADIAVEARSAAPPKAPRGLSRAKLYAFHAAVAAGVATAACGGETTTTGGEDAARTDGTGGTDSTSGTDALTASDGTAVDDERTATDSIAAVDANSPADVVAEDATRADSGDAGSTKDVVEDDGWGPPPPPYGCVFPGGCDDVTV
jgi:hypothetical protein